MSINLKKKFCKDRRSEINSMKTKRFDGEYVKL